MRLVVREAAEADIAEAARWYEKRSPGLGSEFLRAVDVTLVEIARMPARYPLVRGSARRALLCRFPYSLFFVATPTSSASSPACTCGVIRGIGRSAAKLTANK